MKTWKYFNLEQCPKCGNDLEVLTDQPEGYICDGDDIRCVECDFVSSVSAAADEIWVQDV